MRVSKILFFLCTVLLLYTSCNPKFISKIIYGPNEVRCYGKVIIDDDTVTIAAGEQWDNVKEIISKGNKVIHDDFLSGIIPLCDSSISLVMSDSFLKTTVVSCERIVIDGDSAYSYRCIPDTGYKTCFCEQVFITKDSLLKGTIILFIPIIDNGEIVRFYQNYTSKKTSGKENDLVTSLKDKNRKLEEVIKKLEIKKENKKKTKVTRKPTPSKMIKRKRKKIIKKVPERQLEVETEDEKKERFIKLLIMGNGW